MVDRKPLALNWLQRIHSELKPNIDLNGFINSLRLNSYGDDYLSASEFQEWLQSLGEKINISGTLSDTVRNTIIVKYAADKNWVPTRKTIDSAFINLSSTSWNYFNATKLVGIELLKIGSVMTDAAGKLIYATTESATSLMNATKLIWLPIIGLAGYVIYKNSDGLLD